MKDHEQFGQPRESVLYVVGCKLLAWEQCWNDISQYFSLSWCRHRYLHLKTRTTKARQNTTTVKEEVQAEAKLSEAKQSYTGNIQI